MKKIRYTVIALLDVETNEAPGCDPPVTRLDNLRRSILEDAGYTPPHVRGRLRRASRRSRLTAESTDR